MTDGSENWRFSGDWARSSPTVVKNTLYIGGNDDRLYALNREDGSKRWHFNTNDDIRSSPTVVDGTVYVGSDDGGVYAIDAYESSSSEGSRVLMGTLGDHNLNRTDFEVTIVRTNDPISPGDSLTAELEVANPGGLHATQHVEIGIGELEPRTKTFSLGGGESTTESITLPTPKGDSGEYTLRVSSAAGTVTKTINLTAQTSSDESSYDSEDDQESDETPTANADDSGPGFGIGAGLVGVSSAGYLLTQCLPEEESEES